MPIEPLIGLIDKPAILSVRARHASPYTRKQDHFTDLCPFFAPGDYKMQKIGAKGNPEEPTLSACMIVKNEEKLLPQCLESIKDAVDEIILVDTGSTDKTVKIAEKYGARVFHHPWRGDFSEARNYSLQQATCDWILVVDADEKLEREDVPALREALRQEGHSCILAEVLSETPSGVSKNNSQRVFRRGMGHYEGIVHNQLMCDGNILATKIRIYLCGW